MDIAPGVAESESDSGRRSYGQKPNVSHSRASREEQETIMLERMIKSDQ